jgi:hypothetical protein
MKKTFILLFLTWSLTGISQEYHPLIGESNEWYVLSCFEGCITDKYFLGKDSMINSYTYKPLESPFHLPFAFLREDTLGRKVFALTRFNTEIIYLDFSLNENDSIMLTNLDNHNLGWFYVDSIRQINTLAGARKIINLNGISIDGRRLYPVWVEGIGSLGSPQYPAHTSEYLNLGELSCAFRNGIKLYESELAVEYGTCEIYTEVQEISTEDRFKIFPNPSSSSIYIEPREAFSSPCLYKVYNSTGGICKEGVLRGEKEELNFELPGIYYIVISDESRILESRKVLISG